MIKQTAEEVVGRLKDADVLDILREVVKLEIILFEMAKAKGHDVGSIDSPYVLFFGGAIKECGPDHLIAFQKSLTPGDGREVLKMFLEFNYCLAVAQGENPDREIFCASLNVSEVLRAGICVITD
jgi:hypothetical protein